MLNEKDARVCELIKRMAENSGLDVFSDIKQALAVVTDYLTESDLECEKKLLMRAISSGKIGVLAKASADTYLSERQMALTILTEKESFEPSSAERVLGWFDEILSREMNAEEQCKIGVCYHNGNGVPQSDEEAVRWFRLAANQELQFALEKLNEMGY